jgi:hypothetical protein
MPSDSPSSQCGLGSKSKAGGSPQVLDGDVVGLGFSGGHFVAGEVGNAGERQAQLLVEAAAVLSSSSSLSLRARVSSMTAAASSFLPAFLSAPTCCESSLRRALSCSDCVMASRRLLSRARKSPSNAAGSAPRARSFSSTNSRLARTNPKSSITSPSLTDERYPSLAEPGWGTRPVRKPPLHQSAALAPGESFATSSFQPGSV